jgi:hypothetical protein
MNQNFKENLQVYRKKLTSSGATEYKKFGMRGKEDCSKRKLMKNLIGRGM